MSYNLKKPTRMVAPLSGDDAAIGAAAPASEPPAEDAAADTAGSGRAAAENVKESFVALFGRLEGLLGDRWTGAHDRLQALFPETAADIDASEKRADETAVAYVDGRGDKEVFDAALATYERAYTSAAHLLAAHDRALERKCGECGRLDLTVVLRDEDGRVFCRACRSPE